MGVRPVFLMQRGAGDTARTECRQWQDEGRMKKEQAEKLLSAACEFQGKSHEAREACRNKYRRIESNEHNILRILVDGQIGLFAEDLTRKVETVTTSVSYQIGLSASFIRTHFLVGDFILDGDLVEAIVLTRKQLESLSRLHELDSKPLEKLAGKVPNIKNVLKGEAGRMYGDLSEVAHFSTPRVGELLHVVERGDLIGPSLLPVHNEQSGACMDMAHFVAVYFIAWMVEKLPCWYPDFDNSERKELLGMTLLTAVDIGVLCIPKEEKKS
jgi:hypothetical protein